MHSVRRHELGVILAVHVDHAIQMHSVRRHELGDNSCDTCILEHSMHSVRRHELGDAVDEHTPPQVLDAFRAET